MHALEHIEMPDNSKIRPLSLIMQELRVIEPDLPASYACVFLFVASAEEAGQCPSVSDIANGLGMLQPSASRAALALSSRRLGGSKATEERPARGRKALGLLERYADPHDLRLIRVKLTPKGRGLLSRMISHMGG